MRQSRRLIILPMLLLFGCGSATPTPAQPPDKGTKASAQAPSFRLPVDCIIGKTCFVQQYVDHDPGPGARDYRCGSRVYDGHDGTDFRIATLAAQRRGVAVLAAADGKVVGGRDGEADHLIASAADKAAVAGRECGNGVMIDHGGGWTSQYCHMANGSVAVSAGQTVKAGQKLGLVGLSGDTQFPHVHFQVRQGDRRVDPFAPDASPGDCSPAPGHTLWTPEVAGNLAYRSTEVLALGFADGAVAMPAIQSESVSAPTAASALVAYAQVIGLRAGDIMRVALFDPAGAEITGSNETMDVNKAEYMLFSGKRPPSAGWGHGRYTARVTVTRGGQVVARGTRTVEL